ncbi:MAG: hypothetical protein ACLSB9_24780 [Hydrogeniiclostridium mannosilyticum]
MKMHKKKILLIATGGRLPLADGAGPASGLSAAELLQIPEAAGFC